MICRVIFLTLCVILAVHLTTVMGQSFVRRIRPRRTTTSPAPPPSSRSKVKAASGSGGPSKAAAVKFAQTRSKSLPQKSASFSPATCPCTQNFCQGEVITYQYILDTNGDECYVTYPVGGIKETLCTGNTYLQPCYDQLTCGCNQAQCKDSGLTPIFVEAVCPSPYYPFYRFIYPSNVQIYTLCCCE